jgi:hypothetical protein
MSDMRGVSEVDGISEFKYSSMANGAQLMATSCLTCTDHTIASSMPASPQATDRRHRRRRTRPRRRSLLGRNRF